MKSSIEQLRDRGYIDDMDLSLYEYLDRKQLIEMLSSKLPWKRTISVRLLRQYRDLSLLNAMIHALLIEKKLYPKIELSEAIAEYKQEASAILINHLGEIGANQHQSLPDKPFAKKNYPLPRDIIARTICKIGIEALPDLIKILNTGTYNQQLEAVDAVGFISYYEKNLSSLNDLINLYNTYNEDSLMVWKILRAMQAFNHPLAIHILYQYIDSDIEPLKWEANRSLSKL